MNSRRAGGDAADGQIAYLGALGPIEAWDAAGRQVRVTRGQQRVLAVLMESPNRVVSDQVLQEKLWSGEALKGPMAVLQTNIWQLRNLFGREKDESATPSVRRRGSGYELHVDPSELDWLRHERLREAARAALVQQRLRRAKEHLLDARRLWRGEALLGLATEMFVGPFLGQLEAARAELELQLIEVGLALGEHHELIPSLRLLTGRDPRDESLARCLMLALFRSGRQAEALQAYDVCRKALAGDGLVPTARLAETESAILAHAPEALAPPPQPAFVGAGLSGTVLVGRWAPAPPPPWAPGDSELVLRVEQAGGAVMDTAGPSFVACFEDLDRALEASLAIQGALKRRGGPLGRFVVHGGSWAALRGGRLLDVCRRLLSDADVGQILVFGAVEAAPPPAPPWAAEANLRELGEHHLAGGEPVRLFELVVPELAGSRRAFPLVVSPPSNNLPDFRNRFVGREGVVEEVALALSRGRVVTLIGPGGSGKTRLAVEVARRLVSDYRDGTWFVELEWLTDPELVAGKVADVIGLDRSRNVPATEVLRRELAGRQALIVLDGCERLVDAVRLLVEHVVASCPHVSMLTTSLRPLGCDTEELVGVPPLETPPLPGSGTARAPLREVASVRLFCDHLEGPAIGDDELPLVADVCRLVDGLPLAIALAAARARPLGLGTLAAELQRTFAGAGALRLLGAGGRLARTLEWTYSLLGDVERRALAALSVFAGPFSLDEARELLAGAGADSVAATLVTLTGCSAVVVEQGAAAAPRYRLLQPVRAFAAEKLDEQPGERRRLDRAHAEMYLRRAREADAAFGGPDEWRHLAALDACVENLRSAVNWAIGAGDGRMATGLVAALWRYWFCRGHLAEGLILAQEALALEKVPTSTSIRALGGSSYLAWWTGDLQYTLKSAQETAAQAEVLGDRWGEAWAPLGLAAVAMFSDSPTPPGAELDSAVKYFVEAGLAWETGQALQLEAGRAWYRGDYAAAAAHFGRAAGVSRASGSQTFMDSLQGHGLMLALQGRIDDGVVQIQRGLELADRRRDPVGVCHALTYRGAIANEEGDFDEAARLFALALRVAADIGEMWIVQWTLEGLAAWASSRRPEDSARLFGHVARLAYLTGIRLPPKERAAHRAAAQRVARALGHQAWARAHGAGQAMDTPAAVELALGLGT